MGFVGRGDVCVAMEVCGCGLGVGGCAVAGGDGGDVPSNRARFEGTADFGRGGKLIVFSSKIVGRVEVVGTFCHLLWGVMGDSMGAIVESGCKIDLTVSRVVGANLEP